MLVDALQARKPSYHWQTRATRHRAESLTLKQVTDNVTNNLFEVGLMEIRCLVIKFVIQITITYSS